MVNPNKITDYKLNRYRLEEMALFWICVAGKKASSIAPRLQRLLADLHYGLWGIDSLNPPLRPFQAIREVGPPNLEKWLKQYGIGCYKLKAKGMYALATSDLNLRKCTVDDLDAISGIGLKTASCFVMHSRENARCAGLDTHILKFLADIGCVVPKSTPGSKKKYKEIEAIFLRVCDLVERQPAALDLLIWRVYSGHPHLKPWLIRIFRTKIRKKI